MSTLEALLTLAVGILASGALTEIVKRHNRRSSIVTDLQIYEKLPDGATKAKLIDDVTTRVWQTTSTPKWPSFTFGLLFWAGSVALTVWTYGVKLERDGEGVMRAIGVGINLNLYNAALLVVGYGMFSLVCVAAGVSMSEKLSAWWSKRAKAKGVADAAKKIAAKYSSNPIVVEKSREMIENGEGDETLRALARAVVEAADAAEEPAPARPRAGSNEHL